MEEFFSKKRKFSFLRAFLNLTRPLSNVKNIALIFLSFYFSAKHPELSKVLLGFFALSFVSSAVYSYNTVCDSDFDNQNKNKRHYSKAVEKIGEKKSLAIVFLLFFIGIAIAFLLNLNFVFSLLLLFFAGFLYSAKKIRFKEKFILDVLFGGFIIFLLKFFSSWFIFSNAFPPLLLLSVLAFVKSGGYLFYKEIERPFFTSFGIRNSITAFSKKTIIIVFTLFFILAIASFVFLCLNSRYLKIDFLGVLPIKFLILIPFSIPPLIIVYLLMFNKIKTDFYKLRIIGLIYLFLLIIAIIMLLWQRGY